MIIKIKKPGLYRIEPEPSAELFSICRKLDKLDDEVPEMNLWERSLLVVLGHIEASNPACIEILEMDGVPEREIALTVERLPTDFSKPDKGKHGRYRAQD